MDYIYHSYRNVNIGLFNLIRDPSQPISYDTIEISPRTPALACPAPFSPLRLTPRACDLPVHKTTGPSLYQSFRIPLAAISTTVKVPKSRSPIHVRVSSSMSPLLIGLSDIARSRFLLQRFPCTRNPRNAEPRLLGISRHVSLRSTVLTMSGNRRS
jgi:hypothetical protein